MRDSHFQSNLQANVESVLAQGTTLQRSEWRWISKVETADGPMVVKMFVERCWRHSIKRKFLCSRATIYTKRARQLAAAGIPTPVPVATVAENFAGLIGNSCVVYRYASGQTLRMYLQSIADDENVLPEQRYHKMAEIREQLASLGERLARIGLAHTDVHQGNFLVDQNQSISLLDLDSLRPTRKRYRLFRSRLQFQQLVP
ncbi:lipopolysaccharide kinase InaA family protein [Allorhodopirellula solitaria]|uniref:lipopolysaccharide kinase InaA family protein n=1 Tax=Allorhodopirellula solitaria TaxID=2527987 RepID=UPI001648A416|nr:lipopolysaccharide kinase InaA family protein [Allorhodopirellula solitaria]